MNGQEKSFLCRYLFEIRLVLYYLLSSFDKNLFVIVLYILRKREQILFLFQLYFYWKQNNLQLNLGVYQICCSLLPSEQGEMSIKFVELEIYG